MHMRKGLLFSQRTVLRGSQNSMLKPFQERNCQISPRSSDLWPPKRSKLSEIFISGIGKRHSATG